SLALIEEALAQGMLNRVVVAGCPSRLYHSQFQELMRKAGLPPHFLERVNIREGCAWVHRDDPQAATAKARELTAMAVANVEGLTATSLSPVASVEVDSEALVIGGGLAGMTAALDLSRLGHPVHLVEREGELGGNLRHVHYTLEGGDPQALLRSLIERVGTEELIHVYLGAEVNKIEGNGGSYRALLSLASGEEKELNFGVVIVATGGQEAETEEYLYGRDPRVVTQRELEALLAKGEVQGVGSVVMIQCVGSREEERPYCSRFCCSQAVKNALKIKELHPKADVFILYQEVRTYGFREQYYQEARDKGVIFIRYELPHKPKVFQSVEAGQGEGDRLRVEIADPILGRELTLDADLLVLSLGVVPNDNRALAGVLGVPLNEDGFFEEDHSKMRPLDFTASGFYLCGLAHSPRAIDETVSQAHGAAMRAAAFLSQRRLYGKEVAVTVNRRLCSGCGLCVAICPYGARVMNEEEWIAEVIDVLCQGCGACVVACPNKATQQRAFESGQMLAVVDAALG
ncbi:MAG: CoB--CoM heterodisulfide reductase iron-sulfur subunit A family protein, partial [Anaerolineae bacterium]